MVHDAEGLHDQLKDLMKELRTMYEDSKQVSKNIFDGEQMYAKAKQGLNAVLKERKLLINKGKI